MVFIKVVSQEEFQSCVADSTWTRWFSNGFYRGWYNRTISPLPAQQAGNAQRFLPYVQENPQGGVTGSVRSPGAAPADGSCPSPAAGCPGNIFLFPKLLRSPLINPVAFTAHCHRELAVLLLWFSALPMPKSGYFWGGIFQLFGVYSWLS